MMGFGISNIESSGSLTAFFLYFCIYFNPLVLYFFTKEIRLNDSSTKVL
jgi:hypothetical protein